MSKQIEQLIEDSIQPTLKNNDAFLWSLSLDRFGKNQQLRIEVDGLDHQLINMDQIVSISQEISQKLDELDPIEEEYTLDISSPGAERTLVSDMHYKWALNEQIKVKLFEAIEGIKEFSGKLIDVNDNLIKIETDNGQELQFEKSKIAKSNIILGEI